MEKFDIIIEKCYNIYILGVLPNEYRFPPEGKKLGVNRPPAYFLLNN